MDTETDSLSTERTEMDFCEYRNGLCGYRIVIWGVKIERHYENTPMQYTAIFRGCKNVNFQMKYFNIFLIFAQNIDCGYAFTEAVLTSTHNLCFGAKIRKYCIPL